MTYWVGIPPSVEREIAALTGQVLNRIHKKIIALSTNPRPSGTKKLAGGLYWRVRTGDYRIVYEIDDKAHSILLTRVRHRRDAYRGL